MPSKRSPNRLVRASAVVVDSGWLVAAESDVSGALKHLKALGVAGLVVAVPPSVALEVLAGAREPQKLELLIKRMVHLEFTHADARRAAELLREVRKQRGEDHGVSGTDAEVAVLGERVGTRIVYTDDVEHLTALQEAGAEIVVRKVPTDWQFQR